MAKNKLKTGEKVEKSGIYSTGNPKTPRITLSNGDKVPPVRGKSATVKLATPTKKSTKKQ